MLNKWDYVTAQRNAQIDREQFDRVDDISYNADLAALALEGLEVRNDSASKLHINLFLSKSSGRFYLDIDEIRTPELKQKLEFEDVGMTIDAGDHDWVPVKIKVVA